MSDKPPLEFVDVKGKKSFKCPRCSNNITVPLREISMEKLQHLKQVEQIEKWHKEHTAKQDPNIHGVGNVRIMFCPQCGIALILKDEFSTEH